MRSKSVPNASDRNKRVKLVKNKLGHDEQIVQIDSEKPKQVLNELDPTKRKVTQREAIMSTKINEALQDDSMDGMTSVTSSKTGWFGGKLKNEVADNTITSKAGTAKDGLQSTLRQNNLGGELTNKGGQWEDAGDSSHAEADDNVQNDERPNELGQNSKLKNSGGQWEKVKGATSESNASQIASMMDDMPDVVNLFSEYVSSRDNIYYEEFLELLDNYGGSITEDHFLDLLDSNEEFLFEEDEDDNGPYWLKTEAYGDYTNQSFQGGGNARPDLAVGDDEYSDDTTNYLDGEEPTDDWDLAMSDIMPYMDQEVDEDMGSVVGSVAGGMLGGPVGAIAGGAAGSMLDDEEDPLNVRRSIKQNQSRPNQLGARANKGGSKLGWPQNKQSIQMDRKNRRNQMESECGDDCVEIDENHGNGMVGKPKTTKNGQLLPTSSKKPGKFGNKVPTAQTANSRGGKAKDGFTKPVGSGNGLGGKLKNDFTSKGWEKLGSGAGSMRENINRLAKSVQEASKSLVKGSKPLKLTYSIVSEGIKTKQRRILAESLLDFEELVQAYGPASSKFIVNAFDGDKLVARRNVQLPSLKARKPLVFENKVLFRHAVVARNYVGILSESVGCAIKPHSWGVCVVKA